MPGIEVFTISGAPYFGAPGAYMSPLPEHAPTTPAPANAPPAVRLQNALVALGVLAGGDPALTSVRIDGVVGPATVKAVNYGLAHFVGATQFFPKANLDLAKVRQYAGGLAGIIEDHIRKRGGTIPTPQVVARAPRALSITSAAAAILPPSDAPTDRRWVFWAVGGAGALVLLAVAASAVKKRRAAA